MHVHGRHLLSSHSLFPQRSAGGTYAQDTNGAFALQGKEEVEGDGGLQETIKANLVALGPRP